MTDAAGPPARRPGRFPETDWSNLGRLREGAAGPAGGLPLERLAGRYWSPICQYLMSKGCTQADAQDLAQDFFVFAMTSGLFARADRSRGRFRSFLLTALGNFAANERRRLSTQRRAPEGGTVSLDETLEDAYFTPAAIRDDETPEKLFHTAWTHEVLRNVLRELEAQLRAAGRGTHYQLFHARVVAPVLDGVAPPPLEQQAAELGLAYKDAANRIVTARRAFLRLLLDEVRSYAGSDDDVAVEQREVLQRLSW